MLSATRRAVAGVEGILQRKAYPVLSSQRYGIHLIVAASGISPNQIALWVRSEDLWGGYGSQVSILILEARRRPVCSEASGLV
jgi:hypothetical protein